MRRRKFIRDTGAAIAATIIGDSLTARPPLQKKQRIAMVGTGHRGTSMWGIPVIEEFGHLVEFVGLCDINPGRVETAKKMLGVHCATFTEFDKMMKDTKPDR